MGERYANIPLSEKTRAGMSLNIDDLAGIGRVLSLQDNAYDEQFEKLNTRYDTLLVLLIKQDESIKFILDTVVELKANINELKDKVSGLEVQMGQITTAVDSTVIEVNEIKQEVTKLKKLNSPLVIFIRIMAGVATALGLIRWVHGPFN
jgi:FtsZ-binding cell division protein ZapB